MYEALSEVAAAQLLAPMVKSRPAALPSAVRAYLAVRVYLRTYETHALKEAVACRLAQL